MTVRAPAFRGGNHALRQQSWIKPKFLFPRPADWAARRLVADEIEKQPHRVETVPALQLGAFFGRIFRLYELAAALEWRLAEINGLYTRIKRFGMM